MAEPKLSAHFAARRPSVIRMAQIAFSARRDEVEAINVAIGNVSLPMHPALQQRLRALGVPGSPFAEGVVKYSPTVGLAEANAAFKHIIAASGFATDGLLSQVTDGGSQAMELVILGCCGPAGSAERPLLLIDAAYTNYKAFAERLGRRTVSVTRTLGEDGRFELPSLEEIEQVIRDEKPGGLLVIPYDNPTGQLYDHETMAAFGRLCVKHGLWLISDEAYRELYYKGDKPVSVWGISEQEVPGIAGHRISIETASKVWNACGLRIGALITDSAEFHQRAVAENTAGLCSNIIGQHIFAALGEVPHSELHQWFARQREYYGGMLQSLSSRLRDLIPGIIVSSPDASIYSVIDMRNLVDGSFDALDFVMFCAREGQVQRGGQALTLLTAPMAGFYSTPAGVPNPGRTQLRIAYVETPERMALVPELLAELLEQYLARA